MKILRIAHHAPESAWRQRERELRKLGIDIQLISAQTWNVAGSRVKLAPGGDTFVRGARTFGRHPSLFVFDPRPIWRALGADPDLIDLHEEPNALATAEVLLLRRLRRSSAPVVLYSAQNIRKRYPLPFRAFERYALRTASAAYVCNTEAGEILDGKGLAGKSTYIPLGVDLTAFSPVDRSAPGDEPTIGYVGRLEPHKGVDVLLDAVARHRTWRLRIVGDGPERDALAERARRLGIADRVTFVGFVGSESLPTEYGRFDVLAVPSVPTPRWREQFCRVAVEAMAAGVPVVASRTGALPDVVGDAGLLAEPGDPDALSAALLRALEPDRWRALRAAGSARVGDFSWEAVARAQRAMYESVLAPTARPEDRALNVVIVAYGPPIYLDTCLTALGTDYPVTIIDNSALSETKTIALRHGARYIDAGGNVGFAAGVNLGLKAFSKDPGTPTDVLLLNPDAQISGESVRAMHQRLLERDRRAAVGTTQIDPRSNESVRVWWPFPSPTVAWLTAVGLGRLSRRRDFAIGSILLLRAEALADVGPFDERFFLYAEETDWQMRATQRGWEIDVTDVAATHEGGATSSDSRVREQHFFASQRAYLLKHHGTKGWESFRRASRFGAAIRMRLRRGDGAASARRLYEIFAPEGLQPLPSEEPHVV